MELGQHPCLRFIHNALSSRESGLYLCIWFIYKAFQELQEVVLMLGGLAFHLYGKVVAFHLDNNTAKAYLYNLGGTVFLFLSRPACHILNLAELHGITLIPAYIPTHLNVVANCRESWFQNGTFFLAELK